MPRAAEGAERHGPARQLGLSRLIAEQDGPGKPVQAKSAESCEPLAPGHVRRVLSRVLAVNPTQVERVSTLVCPRAAPRPIHVGPGPARSLHDRSRQPLQALRVGIGGQRCHVPLRARAPSRAWWPQRRREIYDAADDLRAGRFILGPGDRARLALPGDPQPWPPRRRSAGRLGAARRAVGEETLNISAMTLGIGPERVAAVLEDVGLAGRPRASVCGRTRSACASGSASPTRCSASRSC